MPEGVSTIKECRLLIGGEWVSGAETFPVKDKFSGETVAEAAKPSREQVAEVVRVAKAAFEAKPLGPQERYEILQTAAGLLGERRERFVESIVTDTGFTTGDASGEIDRAQQTLLLSAEESKRLHGEMIPVETAPGHANRLGFTIRVPVGVVCAITPFNSPLNTVSHKVAPALAAGNAVILKPAPQTPLTAVNLCEMLIDAGVPPGYLNLINGDEDVGTWLLEEPDVAFYTFTGSTRVGKIIQASAGLRRTQLELGNISGTIVCADADLDYAVPRIVNASFRKAGQVCTSVQRLFVDEAILEPLTEKLAAEVKTKKVGDPRVPGTFVGPMIDIAEAERAEAWVKEAVADGARLVMGGGRDGVMFDPTILVNVEASMRVICEEIFAPVISIPGIFTTNINTGLKAAKALRVGGVHINDTSSSRVDLMPYGGVKESGFGREGPKYAAHEMTEERMVTISVY
jgi:succinate-semialdehyde dehydrogenase/glutarate-semialdehyde dehydrogenase